ncbi:MAG: caspase family protein [Flavobacteriales bacterium]|nr:caspase family protein [Flavobacteriales bacterium]
MKFIRTLSLVLLVGCTLAASAQGGKAFLKEGDALRKAGQLEQALEKYGLAVSVDPKLVKAYQARAEVNELLGHKQAVATDRRHIAELVPEDAGFGAAAAMAYLEVDSPAVARRLSEAALKKDAKNMQALQARIRACLKLGDLDCATAASDAAVNLKGSTDTYYLRGLVRTATRDYQTAESDLDRVIAWNHLYEPAYVAQAEVQLAMYERYTGPTMQMRTLEKAIDKCRLALELNPQSTDALFWRSKAYAAQKEYAKAIDDISRCLALGRTDRAVYLQRALYYHGYGQHQNAVNDLNRLILEDPKDIEALLLRAECREANLDMDGALKDLENAQKEMQGNAAYGTDARRKIDESRTRIAQQVFEMNRESDAPRLTVVEPHSRDSVAQVSAALSHLKVSGHILDRSLLKTITVNGMSAEYDKEEKDPQFFAVIPWSVSDKEIVVQAIDVYDNFTSVVLKVERSEGVPPVIQLTAPLAASDRSITIESGKESLFVEGRVSDGSPIRLIAVNGVNASYAPDQMNPEFSIKVDVKDRDRFTVRAEDQFGNGTDQVYTLVRKAPEVVAVKPTPVGGGATAPAPSRTGTTWVIHIENSNYRNFPATQSTGDAAKMQKAFSNYAISRTINKKNLTKEQLDRFFNIELRDLVRTNKVSTILVWYSGHGKSVGGKAYWVPVDARKDDIYSYFNYGSLKAQMQNYSESVDKTVVVSDAAGSDASFYELTR